MPTFSPRICLLPLTMLPLAGCTAPAVEADLGSSQTSSVVPALVEAATPGGAEAADTPTLVRQLDDDDPAVRLFAIGALQRRTDRRFGYRWYRDAEGRREAVAAWQAWAATLPEAEPAGPSAR